MSRRLRRAWRVFAWAFLAGAALAAFTVPASYVALWGMDALWDHPDPWWRWWHYLFAIGQPDYPDAAEWMGYGALAGLFLPVLLAGRLLWWRHGPAGAARLLARGLSRGIVRGTSDNHGHADWMPLAKLQALFPPRPAADVGGVVVGEADRVDLGPAAGSDFDPEDDTTWGNGGKAALLIDPCKRGSTHGITVGGGGTYKSTTLATTLLTWRKSMFVFDPAEELADLVGGELEYRGRKVVRLGIGSAGPNVLDAIDIDDRMAETRLRAVVGRVIGPIPSDDKGGKFKRWGRTIILALLAHMMWDRTIPRELKTLRALRDGLDGGEEAVRNRLRGIADHSPSPLARSLASSMWGMVKETFDGALGNATEDTEWLASGTYADLVSGDAYRMDELVGGDLAVFCQVPQEALEHTPAVARVLVGCHLDAVFAAKGRVNGRVYFPIDEAVLVGADPSLKLARDQGRKSRITLDLYYQSEGQIEEVWGPGGKKAWFDGVTRRTYAGVQNLDTARDLTAICGKYAVRAVSAGSNRGTSGRPLEIGSASRGSNVNEQEIARDLASPDELLADLRDDERITLVRNRRPARHGAAIAFRRPEFACLLGTTSYRQPNVLETVE